MGMIYKYELEPQDENILVLRGRVLSVGVQGGRIMLWAVHEDEAKPERVRVSVRGTGDQLSNVDVEGFVGTVFIGPFVFHVFVKWD